MALTTRIIYLCVFTITSMVDDVDCHSLARRNRGTVNKSIMRRCAEFKIGTLRAACRAIARNPVFINVDQDVVEQETSIKYFSAKKENTSISTSEHRRVQFHEEAAMFNPFRPALSARNSECSLAGLSSVRKRSTSPWKYVQNTDLRRIPQTINFAKCLCGGCIDIASGKEDYNVRSEEIKTKQRIIYKASYDIDLSQCTRKTCQDMIIDVPVGCHCSIPS